MLISTPQWFNPIFVVSATISMYAGFIRWGSAEDVDSAVTLTTQHLDGFTGRCCSYIEQESVVNGMGWNLFENPSGRDAFYNQYYGGEPSEPVTGSYGETQAGRYYYYGRSYYNVRRPAVTAWWQDGEYQYVMVDQPGYQAWGTAPAYFLSHSLSVFRARQEDIQTWPVTTSYGQPVVQASFEQCSFSTTDFADPNLYTDCCIDKDKVLTYSELAARECIRRADAQQLWSRVSRTLGIHMPKGHMDYRPVIDQLLHTYEFHDSNLYRKGFVGYLPYDSPNGEYMYEWLTQHAYVDALEAIPKANDNSVQNIQAAAELLVALKQGNIMEIPDILMDDWKAWTRSADDAADMYANTWLRYRYEYSTTKMDIDEYVAFGLSVIDRYMRGVTSSRAHGFARYGDYECRCTLNWAEKGLTGLQKFCHGLWESGLEPNAYVLWDFVPFSFVADWFCPVGDVLKVYSDAQYRNAEYYSISQIEFSLRYTTGPIAGLTASHYVRWQSEPLSSIDHSYWFDDGGSGVSPTTVFKRALDSGALIWGLCGRRH